MKLKQRGRDRLNRKYHLEERGTMYVSGMLKQKIKVGGMKIKRDDERCQQFKQNHLFRTNQKLFYETLVEKKQGETALQQQQENLLKIENITNFIVFSPQIAYKLIEARLPDSKEATSWSKI